MALARSEIEHKTIVGPVEKTLEKFLKDAPVGSILEITGENSAEMETIVNFPSVKALAEVASQTKHHLVDRVSQAKIVFKQGVTSSPVVRTLKRVHQH